MTIRLLTAADTAQAKAFLRKHISACMFMMDNLENSGLVYEGAPSQGDYWASFTPDNIINGIIAHYDKGAIMMQAPDANVLHALCRALHKNITRPITRFLGPDSQVQQTTAYFNVPNNAFDTNTAEDLYTLSLSNLISPTMPNTHLTPARDVDDTTIIRWMSEYNIEVLSSPLDKAQADAENRLKSFKTDDNAWVLWHNNIPVSLCGFNAKLSDIVQIGPVWTPPEHRSKSYARFAISQALKAAQQNGITKAVLFTKNPPAIRAYEALGFKCTGDYRLAILKNSFKTNNLIAQACQNSATLLYNPPS